MGDVSRYVAGQVTCLECGYTDLLIKKPADVPLRRRCFACHSTLTVIPMWWPVEDVSAIGRAAMRELHRDANHARARRFMQ